MTTGPPFLWPGAATAALDLGVRPKLFAEIAQEGVVGVGGVAKLHFLEVTLLNLALPVVILIHDFSISHIFDICQYPTVIVILECQL